MNQITAKELSDFEILERFRATGSGSYFDILVKRYGNMVFQVCRRILPTDVDAEDATQATFIKLLQQESDMRLIYSLGGWLHRTAVCVSKNIKKSQSSRSRREQKVALEKSNTMRSEQQKSKSAIQGLIQEEVASLPEYYREVIVLFHLQGNSHEKIAETLHCSISTVRMRLQRGRKRLSDRLKRIGIACCASTLTSMLKLPCAEITPESMPSLEFERIKQLSIDRDGDSKALSCSSRTNPAGRFGLIVSAGILSTFLYIILWQIIPPKDNHGIIVDNNELERIVSIEGKHAEYSYSKNGDWRLARIDQDLVDSQSIKTGNSTQVVLKLGVSSVRMREDTVLHLRKMENGSWKLNLEEGTLLVECNRLNRIITECAFHESTEILQGTKFIFIKVNVHTYTRFDVAQGRIKLKTNQAKDEIITVDAGQACSIGPLSNITRKQAKNVTSTFVLFPSRGRELSHRYCGFFYKDALEEYERQGFFLDSRNFVIDEAILPWDKEEFMQSVLEQAVGSMKSITFDSYDEYLVFSDYNTSEIDLNFDFNHKAFQWRARFKPLELRSMHSFGLKILGNIWDFKKLPESLKPFTIKPKSDLYHRTKDNRIIERYVAIGEMPDGKFLYERTTYVNDRKYMHGFTSDVSTVRIIKQNAKFALTDFAIERLAEN